MQKLVLRTLGVGRGAVIFRNCSSLFVSNRSGNEHPVLIPKPDLIEKFKDVQKLQDNLNARNINTNAAELKELFELYSSLNETRELLEKRREDIYNNIKDLKRVGGKEAESEIEKLKLQGRIVRNDQKNMMKAFWDVEERTMVNCLALPNELDPRTPLKSCQIIEEKIKPGTKPCIDHLDAGSDLIDFRDPHCYYLNNSAAFFDLGLMYYFLEGMKKSGYKTLATPDFAHSAVVEACGANPKDTIGLEPTDLKMNLVGAASLFPFCALFTRKPISYQLLPLKQVAAGKRYLLSQDRGLFGAWQKTCVDFLTFSEICHVEENFEEAVNKIRNLYDVLGWDYRIKCVSAPNLKLWESHRISFEMQRVGGWVEVGNVSLSQTFLSERLTMMYQAKDRKKHNGHVVSGTAVNVTFVLACLLEQKAPLFPECLKPHTFGF